MEFAVVSGVCRAGVYGNIDGIAVDDAGGCYDVVVTVVADVGVADGVRVMVKLTLLNPLVLVLSVMVVVLVLSVLVLLLLILAVLLSALYIPVVCYVVIGGYVGDVGVDNVITFVVVYYVGSVVTLVLMVLVLVFVLLGLMVLSLLLLDVLLLSVVTMALRLLVLVLVVLVACCVNAVFGVAVGVGVGVDVCCIHSVAGDVGYIQL